MHALWILGFTGIDQAYEEPSAPELVLSAGDKTIDECVQQVIQLLQEKVGTISILYYYHFCHKFTSNIKTYKKRWKYIK